MSNYPIWWDTTVTIYNKYIDAQTQVVTWHRYVVENCFWKYVGDKVKINQTVLETNNIICRIPEHKRFLEKYLWVQKPNDEMDNFFTLGTGDIIVKGDVVDIIDEYQAGHRSSDLRTKYKSLQGCLEVQEVAINVGVGRNNPHYFVKGI